VAANPQTKPTDLGCEFADKWLLPSTSTIAICYYYSARKLILVLLSHGGGRLSRPRHCRKGAQLMPKAVHRSGCRDKHNCQWPLTPQSIMTSLNHCDLLRHVSVNNLPKVVTQQRRGRELNSQPASCKSNALATRLPSHLVVINTCAPLATVLLSLDMRAKKCFCCVTACLGILCHFAVRTSKSCDSYWHTCAIVQCKLLSDWGLQMPCGCASTVPRYPKISVEESAGKRSYHF